MPLWRVDVAGISHRYVEAKSKAEAERQVTRDLIRDLRISASPDPKVLRDAFQRSNSAQQKRLVAAIDGLSSPAVRRRLGAERRRLERLVTLEDETLEWMRAEVASAPPLDERRREILVKALELEHVERNLVRLGLAEQVLRDPLTWTRVR